MSPINEPHAAEVARLIDLFVPLCRDGAIVLARLLVLAGRLGRAAWTASARDRLGRALAAGLIGSLVATLVHGLIDNSFFLPDLAALWWVQIGLLGELADTRIASEDQA